MSLTSLFSKPKFHGASAPNTRGCQPRRQPTHSSPSLELLEERTLLDGASSGLIGGINNLSFNGASASSGVILSTPTSGFNEMADAATSGQAATAAFLAQDQLYSQFRIFGVNSQGDDFQQAQRTTVNVLRDAYGFGSGTQPNAPWMPNAYNLGLANRQYGYSSQTDMGFSSVPPWSAHVAQSQPQDQDSIRPLDRGEDAAEQLVQMADKRPTNDPQQSQHDKLLKETIDQNTQVNAVLGQLADEKLSHTEELSHTDKLANTEQPVPQDAGIPDTLWLSALSPVPMASLVAGLPGVAGAAECCDTGAEATE